MEFNFKQAVVFAILMQNGEGILSKAPSYVMEKFEACVRMEKPEVLLDMNNFELLNKYLDKWEK